MIYVWHHAAALVGALLLVHAVYRRRWTRAYPWPAVVLWHLLLFTAATALLGLLLSLGLRAFGLGVVPAVGAVAGGRRTGLGAADVAAITAAAVALAAAAALHVVATGKRRRARRRHRALLDVVGDLSRPGLTVIEHQEVAVYTLPGRSPRIVATAGALRQLPAPELHAVLAHEEGHLAGRHDLALLPFFILRRALPWSRRAVAIEAEVELLLELCADAQAVRRGHGAALLRALGTVGHDTDAARVRQESLQLPPARRRIAPVLVYAAAILLVTTSLSLYLLPT